MPGTGSPCLYGLDSPDGLPTGRVPSLPLTLQVPGPSHLEEVLLSQALSLPPPHVYHWNKVDPPKTMMPHVPRLPEPVTTSSLGTQHLRPCAHTLFYPHSASALLQVRFLEMLSSAPVGEQN